MPERSESSDRHGLPSAARRLQLWLELITALALVDDPRPVGSLRCRGAALRYAEALREGGAPPDVARRLLEHAVRRWAAPELAADRRARLESRVAFWVGTAYGLRWRAAEPAACGPRASSLAVTATERPCLECCRPVCLCLQALGARARAAKSQAGTLVGQTRRIRAASAQAREETRARRAAERARWPT